MKVDYIKESEEASEKEEGTFKEKKDSPRRILVGSKAKTNINSEAFNKDILIVASKLKKYVKDKHGLNTSAGVMEMLSNIVRIQCDRAVENAMREGRKTLMDRDF